MKTKSHVEVAKQAMPEIYVHSKHSNHNLGSESDKYFLRVQPFVFSFATENLKMMVFPSTVFVASLNKTKNLKICWPILNKSHF